MSKNLLYTIRVISMEEDGTHSCTGRIVDVIQSSRNPTTDRWYMTVLVEREQEGHPGEHYPPD